MIERDFVRNNILDEIRALRERLENLERAAVTSLDGLEVDGDVFYDGDLQAQRGNVVYTGYVYVPITPVQLTDTTATKWDASAARNVGTYNFDLQASANGLPAEIKAVALRIAGIQTAGAGNYMGVRARGSATDFQVGHICNVGTYACGSSGICPVDGTNYDIEVVIGGANATGCYAIVYGYWI